MKTKRHSSTVEVFSGFSWEAELVKGLLESIGIASILKTGNFGSIDPSSSNNIVTVLVAEENYQSAMTAIRSQDVSL
ncbi:hypothetical protein EZS27_017488 [termite gut metagenome]|uniref:DUF2007 domain-containing protein n=1 Tax=termite gut metagenome TaxID=433724 RepID=A0A5J4RKG0_9ZZZZ